MSYFNEYPYKNLTDLNLDYILNTMTELATKLSNFININTIKYANPIEWDITTQYEGNTVVIDPQTGYAYISVTAVPSGVSITNTDYWVSIFNYEDALNTLREQIAAANEEGSATSTDARAVGDLVWLNGRLAKIISVMIAGDSYVENSNFEYITIEDLIKNIYYPSQELLKINAIIDGEAEVTVGDVHTYSEGTSTITITEG